MLDIKSAIAPVGESVVSWRLLGILSPVGDRVVMQLRIKVTFGDRGDSTNYVVVWSIFGDVPKSRTSKDGVMNGTRIL